MIGPVLGGDLLLGGWQAAGKDVPVATIRDALDAALPSGALSFAKGVEHFSNDASGFAEAVRIAPIDAACASRRAIARTLLALLIR